MIIRIIRGQGTKSLHQRINGTLECQSGDLVACLTTVKMAIESISHTFYDIELEHLNPPNDLHLVKILSVDGRRFTYELRAPLTEEAVTYIKSLIDAVVFSDMIIELTTEGFEARESRSRMKKHS